MEYGQYIYRHYNKNIIKTFDNKKIIRSSLWIAEFEGCLCNKWHLESTVQQGNPQNWELLFAQQIRAKMQRMQQEPNNKYKSFPWYAIKAKLSTQGRSN